MPHSLPPLALAPRNVRGQRHTAVWECAVELDCWLAPKEEEVELLVTRRLRPLAAAHAQPAPRSPTAPRDARERIDRAPCPPSEHIARRATVCRATARLATARLATARRAEQRADRPCASAEQACRATAHRASLPSEPAERARRACAERAQHLLTQNATDRHIALNARMLRKERVRGLSYSIRSELTGRKAPDRLPCDVGTQTKQ
jgi:hypothetical protein